MFMLKQLAPSQMQTSPPPPDHEHMWALQQDGSFIKIHLIFHDVLNLCLHDREPISLSELGAHCFCVIRAPENESYAGIRQCSQPANGQEMGWITTLFIIVLRQNWAPKYACMVTAICEAAPTHTLAVDASSDYHTHCIYDWMAKGKRGYSRVLMVVVNQQWWVLPLMSLTGQISN